MFGDPMTDFPRHTCWVFGYEMPKTMDFLKFMGSSHGSVIESYGSTHPKKKTTTAVAKSTKLCSFGRIGRNPESMDHRKKDQPRLCLILDFQGKTEFLKKNSTKI